MKTLFVKTGCPYCGKVLNYLKDHPVPLTIKNVAEPGVVEELIAEGGERQVPFLRDVGEGKDFKIYESSAIIDYLSKGM